jgi:hypothetical protein
MAQPQKQNFSGAEYNSLLFVGRFFLLVGTTVSACQAILFPA